MADSYESVMNFGISAHYSPNVGEKTYSRKFAVASNPSDTAVSTL